MFSKLSRINLIRVQNLNLLSLFTVV